MKRQSTSASYALARIQHNHQLRCIALVDNGNTSRNDIRTHGFFRRFQIHTLLNQETVEREPPRAVLWCEFVVEKKWINIKKKKKTHHVKFRNIVLEVFFAPFPRLVLFDNRCYYYHAIIILTLYNTRVPIEWRIVNKNISRRKKKKRSNTNNLCLRAYHVFTAQYCYATLL
jgi:hypothetical protein